MPNPFRTTSSRLQKVVNLIDASSSVRRVLDDARVMLDAGFWMLDPEHGQALRWPVCGVGESDDQAAFFCFKCERSIKLSISALRISATVGKEDQPVHPVGRKGAPHRRMIPPAGIQHPETSIQHRCAGAICIERSNNTTNGSNGLRATCRFEAQLR